MFHRSHHKWFLLGFTGALISMPAVACGPFFPNQLLFNSGEALTWGPVADFHHEIDALIPKQSEFHALPPDEKSNAFDQSADLDMADLRDALNAEKIPDVQRAELLQKYAVIRTYRTQYAKDAADALDPQKVRPLPTGLAIPKGLPAEFEAYVRGVILYDDSRKDDARATWESILQLPADQRRYRAVWAQFMIGKSYLGNDSAKATVAFQQVRELARKGAKDSLGLAAASLGWEARAEIELKHEARAIELYEAQGATGDPTAVQSLAIVCERAFGDKDPEVLTRLATYPASARVLTAYALALGGEFRARPTEDRAKLWLSAVEKSGMSNVIGADQLAWAAYQAGDMASAQRWVDKAAEKAPMALWIRAKLLLRAGKSDAAAKVLAEAVHAFPQDEKWSSVSGTYDVGERSYPGPDLSPADRAGAELGALQLARGQYVESLDRLLKAGWWLDAAYVAERVLTEDELIAYVDRNCPVGTHPELRHLLARRLTRGGRWKEARGYFPAEFQPQLDSYIAAIRDGHNSKLSNEARATAFWNAAKIARHEGMDLLGTELTPDDFADQGNYAGSDVPEERQKSKDALFPPTADELKRVSSSGPNPQKRWHYRYIAADHAWAAAELMPDETDGLAALLCEAGGWLQAKDPKAAERFYKALVSRCGTTALGRWAKKDKWFPNTLPTPASRLK